MARGKVASKMVGGLVRGRRTIFFGGLVYFEGLIFMGPSGWRGDMADVALDPAEPDWLMVNPTTHPAKLFPAVGSNGSPPQVILARLAAAFPDDPEHVIRGSGSPD